MATYEYMCDEKHVTSQVQPMTEKTKETVQCSTCNSTAKRIYTVPGIQFKGRGFYSNGG